MTLHDIKDHTPNPHLIAQIEDMLELAQRGEVRSLFGVWGWADGSVSSGWSADPRSSRRLMLAEFVVAQQDFITAIGLDEGDSVLARAMRGE